MLVIGVGYLLSRFGIGAICNNHSTAFLIDGTLAISLVSDLIEDRKGNEVTFLLRLEMVKEIHYRDKCLHYGRAFGSPLLLVLHLVHLFPYLFLLNRFIGW